MPKSTVSLSLNILFCIALNSSKEKSLINFWLFLRPSIKLRTIDTSFLSRETAFPRILKSLSERLINSSHTPAGRDRLILLSLSAQRTRSLSRRSRSWASLETKRFCVLKSSRVFLSGRDLSHFN